MISACHGSGGSGPQFSFGGTIYTDATGATPAADVEIRGVDSAGKDLGLAHSDSDGNFWFNSTTVFSSGKTAARSATNKKPMISGATGACNQCHKKTGGVTSVVYVQ